MLKAKKVLTVVAGNFESQHESHKRSLYGPKKLSDEFRLEMLEDVRKVSPEAQEKIRQLQRMLANRFLAPVGPHLRRS